MNIENMKKLIDQLKRLPDEKFLMSNWVVHPKHFGLYNVPRSEDCGTVACIAGWACLLNGGPTEWKWASGSNGFSHWAREWLGLDRKQADHLFSGDWVDGEAAQDLTMVTRAEAIAHLESMLLHESSRTAA